MNRLNPFSWSINVKVFVIILVAFVVLTFINTPLSIETFSNVNRRAFQQVVTESALRQQAAIDEDFSSAITIFDQFQQANISYLSVFQWLSRSDPSTEGFDVNATQTLAAAERAIETEILSVQPSLYRQAWLIDLNGRVISNITNFIAPRFEVSVGNYVDASETPAHLAGQLLGSISSEDRAIDLVVEEVDNRTSIQLVMAITNNAGESSGSLVVELNNVGIVLSNLQLSGTSNDVYSFVASPSNSSIPIALGDTISRNLVNFNSQAIRSSLPSRQAQSYASGNRRVIGYYAPLFSDYRNDIIFVVEVDEAQVLGDVSLNALSTSLPTILLIMLFAVIATTIISRLVVYPIGIITRTIRAMNVGDFTSSLSLNTNQDEVGKLAETVVELRQQLAELTQDVAGRIDARTRDLQITQEISRVAISETDLDRLMTRVVDLIAERFEQIYHAQIFLVEGNYAVLKASTGEAGEQLLTQGHRLGIGSLSVIGQVTQQNQTIVARDTATSEVHQRNEFLSETRAELAIPLRLESQVIGALDIQSKLPEGFDEELVSILETMADQIAIAIENTRLYTLSQQRVQEFEKTSHQRTQRNWEDFMHTHRTQQIASHAGAQAIYDFANLRQTATTSREITIGDITERDTIPIAIPIVIREQVLGVIEWEIPEAEFNQNRILLAEELAVRLAVSLDNARLVQAGRQSAENERIVNAISAKISGQTDIEQILQTAIQEVGQALRAPQVNIRLRESQNKSNGHQDNGHNSTADDN